MQWITVSVIEMALPGEHTCTHITIIATDTSSTSGHALTGIK